MPALPSGTVTLLFTDIEGSTQLLHRLGERYAQVLRDHHLCWLVCSSARYLGARIAICR